MEKNKDELKIYLINDNKSGYKTKKNHIKNNFPNLFNDIVSFSDKNNFNNLKFIEQLFLYIHEMKEIPLCEECEKPLKFKKSLNEGYNTFCSINCSNKSLSHINNVKETNIKKYGGTAPSHSVDVKKKMEETNLKKYGVKNYFENKEIIQEKIKEKYGNNVITKTEHHKRIMNLKYEKKYEKNNIKKNNELIEYFCEKCNEISVHDLNSFNYRERNNIPLCKKCIPPYQSLIEKELELFLIDNNCVFKRHDRITIKPKEIDFFLYEKNIGIELNGLYWHSEKFYTDIFHHQNKWKMSNDKNIKLIQIWEDEWKFKKEIVINILNNNIFNNFQKIGARKCEIKLLSNNSYKTFVEKYHIQGYAPSKYRIGLFYNNELIQLMSFSSNRISMGGKKIKNEYELIRLCTKFGITVIGGSERLLKYFENLVNPEILISYCNLRYFTGNSYLKMGFKFDKITRPNYFYFKPNNTKRYYRYNFRKSVLVKEGFDPNKTEKEIMEDLGFLKIWDCGNKKFIKIYSENI